MELGCLFQTTFRLLLVFSVSNQISSPRTNVKRAQTTTIYPWNLSQPRVMGMMIAGTEIRNVTKIMTAFPIAAIHIISIEHSPRSERKY